MEMPVVNKAKPEVPSPAKILEDHALTEHGVDKFDPLREMLDYYMNEANKDSLRFRALERMLEKVHPSPKAADERGSGDVVVQVLGSVEKPVVTVDDNVVSIKPDNDE